MLSTFH